MKRKVILAVSATTISMIMANSFALCNTDDNGLIKNSIINTAKVSALEENNKIYKQNPEFAKKISVKNVQIKGFSTKKKYTGKAVKQNIKLVYNGKVLKNNVDYTVKYKNNVKKGIAQLIVTGKGRFTSSVKKNFRIMKLGWVSKNGKSFYIDKNGKKAKGITEIGKSAYFFNEKGIMQTGWQKVKNDYYFFSRKNGRQIKSKTVNGIKIKKSGKAVKNSYSKSKIETMMTANKILKQITKPTDSKAVKRKKCFDWILSKSYHQFRLLKNVYKTKGWEMTFANDIFKFNCGDCVSESAALAFLFNEIGYDNVAVCHDTAHSWTTIGKRIFDPVFAEAKNYQKNYNVLPYDYRVNPVGKAII